MVLTPSLHQDFRRVVIYLHGALQGVGFRPFVYRLGKQLRLSGFVRNSSRGVIIEAEGLKSNLEEFLVRLQQEHPSEAVIQNFEHSYLSPQGYQDFIIKDSQANTDKTAVILPDQATCGECLVDIFDPSNRRYLYPFTNCTHCGPRYSILEDLPYDRAKTSMKDFLMCLDCRREYEDPDNRRFHAQPNACPICGPAMELWDSQGNILSTKTEAIEAAAKAILGGKIIALKGLGGFQLLVDARNDEAVHLLRQRKNRLEKPLAMMFPTLESIKLVCHVNKQEEVLLLSPQAPIVLLKKKEQPSGLSSNVCPGSNPYLGVMLSYTPLHHLLMRQLNIPIVATSGNLSDEPICIDNQEVLSRLQGIADFFLVHNRPIVRAVDDSVVHFIQGEPALIRRARGYAPFPVTVKSSATSVMAMGAHLKNTVALKFDDQVFLSQHIGDLETPQSLKAFGHALESLRKIYSQPVDCLVCDHHPDYFSTRYAYSTGEPVISVNHHHAHIAACMAEYGLSDKVLGIAWDGTGLGDDGTIWGGEFLVGDLLDYQRVGHLFAFRLPGAEAAIRHPRKIALALLAALNEGDYSEFSDLIAVNAHSEEEHRLIHQMITKGLQSPVTTSMGRLFDGVSALLGLCQEATFEGQAAMLLEYALDGTNTSDYYPFEIIDESTYILDWRPMLVSIIADIRKGTSKAQISAMFHNTVVEMALEIARRVKEPKIVLGGGCFQNRYLTEKLIDRLPQENFQVYWPKQIPTNDGGIALGQAVIASARLESEI